MKKTAIIVAAGSGERMNADMPKQFLLLKGKPILFYSIDAFLRAYYDLHVIVVLPPDHMGKGNEIIDAYFDNERITICEGGATRFESVKNGLKNCGTEESIIFVHDGVRCLVSTGLIQKCYEEALDKGTAVPAIACKDSVRIIEEDANVMADRDGVRLIQTPQAFHSRIILPAFEIDSKPHFTDEASVIESYGIKINLIEGEERNFKITTPLDLSFAEYLMNTQ